MRRKLVATSAIVVLLISTLLASPVLAASQSTSEKTNAHNVELCKYYDGEYFSGDPYPYSLVLITPDGLIGPFFIESQGQCVSALARHKDWDVTVVDPLD